MEQPMIHSYKMYFIHPFIYEDRNYANIVKCLLHEESQWKLKVYQNSNVEDHIRTEYFLPHIIKFLYPTMYLDEKERKDVASLHPHMLKELSSLDFTLKPNILETYRSFEVLCDEAAFPLTFENIYLKIFHGGVGFLYFSIACNKEQLALNDLIQINQLMRPIRPLYKDYPMARIQFKKNISLFTLKDLLDTLLGEINVYDHKENIYNIYIDRLIFYSYVCVKKDSLATDQWICERTDLLEALRSCSLYEPEKENMTLLSQSDQDQVYFSRHKSSIYGFSKEGGILLAVDRDLKGDEILPNICEAYIPCYFSTYYLDILILGLYQRISLINYCRKLSMLKSLIHYKQTIEHIRFEILKFTNTAWFTQITNSELGMAIWKHWFTLFENEALYCEVKQGLDELDDFLENKRQHRFSLKLGLITAITIPPTLIFSYVGNDFDRLTFSQLLHPKFLISSFLLFLGMLGLLFAIDKFHKN
ncbi:hypothetical protein HNQ80_000116 [Anaerosolibacter carboniphilus]|uniref:CorA-like Mg2+ transporter protein n=1 Tax=Anaerosolibacter carboniphilus TaxID=1417629 RepID=A0A841KKS9_9FIRM|nr:hypothetical protein [Anaerosolibacter carboniphilus]MBB6214047.1 hypothetical protein [Anaerosolibacter carboniphilus]